MGRKIDLTDAQKDRLEERLATLKSASEEVAQKLERKSERALAWLVGQRTKKSTLTDIVAEDEQQEFPPVLAFQKEFARIAAMIRANEAQPYVEPEAQLSFVEEAEDGTQVDHLADIRAVMQELAPPPQGVDPNMDPAAAALASMPQPEQMSDNEIVAAILSARLDRLCERLKMNTLSTLILQQAALDTVAYVYVGYDPREDQSEPTVIEILPAGDVLTDREAPTAHRGRFVGRIERDVRLAEVARRYNKPIDDLRELATQPVDTDNVTVPEDLKYVELVHWWVRNESTVEVPTAMPMDATGMVDAEEAEEQMEDAFGEDESEDLAEDATEEEAEVEEVEDGDDMEPETILKYEGGWQYVVTMNGRVIFNGDSPSADGAPQVYEFGWWPTAQRPYTIGMYDMMVPYTNNLDDMQKIAAESVRKMLPKTYINKAALKTPHGEDDLTDGEVAGTVHVNTGSMPVSNAVMYVPGGGAGSELMAVQDRLSASMQEVVGSAGVNVEDATRSDMSGDMLEGIKQDRQGIAAIIGENWVEFKREIFRAALRNIIAFEDMTEVLRVIGADGQYKTVEVNLAAIAMVDTDLEAAWDVKVTRHRNLPENPVKRADYITSVFKQVVEMAAIDPALAAVWISVADLPYKDKLQKYLRSIQAKQDAAQSAAAGQGAAPSPEVLKIQAEMHKQQQDADIAIRRRSIESMSDGLESVVKAMAASDPERATQIALQIPMLISQAWAGEMATVLQNVQNMLGGGSPQQQQQQAPQPNAPAPAPLDGAGQPVQ